MSGHLHHARINHRLRRFRRASPGLAGATGRTRYGMKTPGRANRVLPDLVATTPSEPPSSSSSSSISITSRWPSLTEPGTIAFAVVLTAQRPPMFVAGVFAHGITVDGYTVSAIVAASFRPVPL